MDWFYEKSQQKQGPVSDTELKALVQNGIIKMSTLVWNPNMPDWKPYEDVADTLKDIGFVSIEGEGIRHACAECGGIFDESELLQFGEEWICGTCKGTVFQKLKEGSKISSVFVFGGFWQRFGAKMIDSLILIISSSLLQALLCQ
ncbi:DUF4339 domain-containing protein [bacterium]|nr:DUF4339 domain-containing protein [bacterium]